MAKEVKDLTSKEASKSEVLPSQVYTPEMVADEIAACNCAKPINDIWVKLDNKLTDVKLELLAKLENGLANGAGIEYLMQLSHIYSNIR